MGRFEEVYRRSLADPEGFWAEAAKAIDWIEPYKTVLDRSNTPFDRWFTGGKLNTSYNCLDRHVAAGHGDRLALIYDSPVSNTKKRFTYRELRDDVALFAGALARLGVSKGDRVIIYMPMVPEALIAMQACARLGAVHSVVFGGFAAGELATRIDDCRPKLVISASCGIEVNKVIAYKPLLDGAIELARHKPAHCIILQRPQLACDLIPGRDIEWSAGTRGCGTPRLRAGAGDRSALYPLHLRHDRPAQGRGARQWRPCGGARLEHGQCL